MDAPCEIQGSIHVFRLVNNMCPGKWVHITLLSVTLLLCADINMNQYINLYLHLYLYLYLDLYLDIYIYIYIGISIV